jgi:spore maturation protein SpmA
MVLNYLWVLFFLVSFAVGMIKLLSGDTEVIPAMVNSTFSMSKTAFEIALALTGVMSLWLGIMKIGEKAGAIRILSRLVGPFFSRLFPGIPKDHPAMGSILMNYSANMLGLDNAATPLGLKAMEELQSINDKKDTASNAMIMFLTLNTAGFTIIPVSILAYRMEAGAANPTDIFLPLIIATYASLLVGMITVALVQRINLLDKVVLAYMGGLIAGLAGLVYAVKNLPEEQVTVLVNVGGNVIILSIIMAFITTAMVRRINVYDTFIEGAKEGFSVAIRIIPYLVAMLVAIGLLRASGTMDIITQGIAGFVGWMGMDTTFADALPVGLMKPFSGSGARGLMVDTMHTFGADSFVGRLSCIFNGSSDTTFYILALYFGSVGIRNTRYAVVTGLIADLASIIISIAVCYLFFG